MMLIRCAVALLLPYATAARSWQLLHSLDSGKNFSERGTVSLALNEEGKPEMTVEHADNCLDLGAINTLSSGLYQVKLVSGSQEVLTSVPACQVRRANFRDELTVTLNAQADAVSVAYTPLVSPLSPRCSDIEPLTEAPSFTTKVSYETAVPGMTIPALLPNSKPPAGLKFFPRSQGAQSIPGVKPEGEEQQKSFLMRYWYIILPLVIMTLTGGGEEEAPAASGQAPAVGGQAAAAPAATAPSAPASAGKARRGKRS